MTKYKVLMIHPDGTEEMEEEMFSSEAEAEAHGRDVVSCIREGAVLLHQVFPDENPIDDFEDSKYKIIEIDE